MFIQKPYLLKKLTILCCLILNLSACGGGSGDGKLPGVSQPQNSTVIDKKPAQTSSASLTSSVIAKSSTPKSQPPTTSPQPLSSFSAQSLTASSNTATSFTDQPTIQSGITSISTSSRSSSSFASGSVKISWSHPQFRENGNYLELSEIAGYELRIKKTASADPTYLVIEGNQTTQYTLSELTNNSSVDLAVYDTNGLYSDFIAMYPSQ